MYDTCGSVPVAHAAKYSATWLVWCRSRVPQNAVSGRFEK
jgi:hypothetical protein